MSEILVNHTKRNDRKYDLSGINVPISGNRTDIIDDIINVYDWSSSKTGRYSKMIFKGIFQNVLLYRGSVIFGKIINGNTNFKINLIIGNTVKFFDEDSFETDNSDIDYLTEHLTRNSVNDHIIGDFNIIYFKEDYNSIINNNTLPLSAKEYLLNKFKVQPLF